MLGQWWWPIRARTGPRCGRRVVCVSRARSADCRHTHRFVSSNQLPCVCVHASQPDPTGELILLALPKFEKGRTFYRSMLRVKVQQIDPAKSLKRKFPDKDEWRGILRQLQDEGELTFTEERDEIVIPLPAAPDA